jgi:hypothetical protein
MANTKKNAISLTDRLDNITDKILDLASDVNDGDITANQMYERLDKIYTDLENFKDFL